MQRIRLTYARGNALRYTGHLDMQDVWERTIRRARLPLAYSQGFHPQPKINQACPLPLGMTSQMEIIDFWLEPELTLPEIQEQLYRALPPGMQPLQLELVDLRSPALQTRVISAQYLATFLIPFDAQFLHQQVAEIKNATSLLRTRRDKQYDLRPLIEDLTLLQTANPDMPHLFMLLAAREGATGRPEEVIAALGYDPLDIRFERKKIFLTETAVQSVDPDKN